MNVHNLPFLLAFNLPFIELVEFRVVFEQHDTFPVVRELNDQMRMVVAIDAILDPLEMSTARLALAGITLKYQSEGGCPGYSDVMEDRILGDYLTDRAKNANVTQDSRPSLYVSLYHGNKKLENSTLSRGDTPASVMIDIVHNTTLHHQRHEVTPNDSSTVIINLILDGMISQANQGNQDNIDCDDIAVYFNGRIPMMERMPLFAYILMYGVTTKELEEPIIISFEIVHKHDPRPGGPFLAVFDRVAPVILTYGELDDGSWKDSIGKCASHKLVKETFQNTEDAPILDRRYVFYCRLFNDLLEANITASSNPWIQRFVIIAKKEQSWVYSLEASEHHQPRVYTERSEYYVAGNHLSTR